MKITFDSEKIIHLFKGSKRYVTIIPYEDFNVMKKNFKNPKGSLPDEKAKSYEIRFSEDVVVQLRQLQKARQNHVQIPSGCIKSFCFPQTK